ncbi:hypothetical protein BDZ97DRAFT_2063512 [Flammula alnicola]|nr:hypothetical protein BDZ97DRAFT_2063512 [Flammula alnicola]
MPLKPGEMCEHCHKHIHPQSEPSKEIMLAHPPPACQSCLPSNQTLKTCKRCKLVRYCGRDCQKAHWPDHKTACKVHIDLRNEARELGMFVEAKQASFARWCENNVQAFALAALSALGIHSQLDRERLQNYAFLITVDTRDITAAGSKKLTFAHSILMARQVSMREMHLRYDWRFKGGAATLEKMLSHTPGLMRTLVENSTLPVPLDLYTLPMSVGEDYILVEHDPQWLAHLKERVK